MDRKQVASVLGEVADLLELKGENTFKVRAYANAARAVSSLEEDLAGLVESGELVKVKGIGKGLAENITELVRTENLEMLDELKAGFPPGLFELLKIQGLGPKKVKVLYEDLGVESLGELEYACRENRLITLKGFGPKSQANILKGIENLKKYRGRHLWAEVESDALDLLEKLRACPHLSRVEPAGSYRRLKEVVKDLDFVAAGDDPDAVVSYLESLDMVESVTGGAETKFSFRLESGIGVDLRIVSANVFPFAWHHFTGSKEHNTQMRGRARSRGLKMNEYGLFDEDGNTVSADDEEAVFGHLDLPYIPPELREGRGEIEAADNGGLPRLIEPSDIKGIFHAHTTFSDGALSVRELVDLCRKAGFSYVGITDHSRSAFYAGGLVIEELEKQRKEIEAIRKEVDDFQIFWGIESDILSDGELDYPDEVLAEFDFVIASIHSNFTLPEKENTERIVRAVRNPYTSILGHPTGRLLLARESYAVNMDAVLEAAAETGTIVEINANPHRLDLDWREMKRAKNMGIKLMVCPDTHSADGLDIRFGVNVARKGWLTAEDVLNTLPADELRPYLKK